MLHYKTARTTPPSTLSAAPVVAEDNSPATYVTRAATSSTVAKRFNRDDGAPSFESDRAEAKPIPAVDPVTNAILPVSLRSMICPLMISLFDSQRSQVTRPDGTDFSPHRFRLRDHSTQQEYPKGLNRRYAIGCITLSTATRQLQRLPSNPTWLSLRDVNPLSVLTS